MGSVPYSAAILRRSSGSRLAGLLASSPPLVVKGCRASSVAPAARFLGGFGRGVALFRQGFCVPGCGADARGESVEGGGGCGV